MNKGCVFMINWRDIKGNMAGDRKQHSGTPCLFMKNAANAYRVSLTNCAVIDDLRRNCCLSDRSLRCFLSCFRCASAPFPRSFALTLPCVFACVVPLGGNPAGLLRGSRAWLIAATILHSSYFVSGCAKLIPYVLLCLVFCCSFVHVPFRPNA